MSCYNVLTHGAVGDGQTNDTASIQAAIDTAHGAGGGTVLLTAGHTYLCGSLVLRSSVELHVERGATLQASSRWEDFTARFRVSALSSGEVSSDTVDSAAFITARDAHDIAITGAGVIDGGGRHFIEEDLGTIYRCTNNRPFTVFLIGCSRVTVRDVTFRDPALWTVRLTGCRDVLVHGLRIDADLKYPNSDGIDLDRCQDVRISDCNISCGDDAISLKTCEEFPEYGVTENVVITNCTLRTTSSGVVVGVDLAAPIRNVVVSNIVITSSHRGLAVNLGQEGDVSDILFSDCVVQTRLFDPAWWGRGEPIYVSAVPWHDKVGTIRNVRFRNILARCENGAYVNAAQPGLIKGVLLENVRIELDRWSGWPGGQYDRRPSDDGPGLYEHPTSGFHIDTASDVTLRHCEVVWGSRPDTFAHAVEAIDVDDLTIDDLVGTSAHPELYTAVNAYRR